ncbi:2-hydroxymuconate tautomerase [Alkalihalophilus marmarensis]|uniref:2-hydroxymuconate tautomerase n=1 Tax=Alkalihalophilus marmarensis TaxID=521377 RepID=UPI00399CBC2D
MNVSTHYKYVYIKGANHMPIVTVQLLEGRTDDQKRALVEKVTDAVSETTGAPAERISVIIDEMKPTNFAVNGKRPSDQ